MSKLFIHIEVQAQITINVFEDHAEGPISDVTDVNKLIDALDQLGFQTKLIGPDSFFATEG